MVVVLIVSVCVCEMRLKKSLVELGGWGQRVSDLTDASVRGPEECALKITDSLNSFLTDY